MKCVPQSFNTANDMHETLKCVTSNKIEQYKTMICDSRSSSSNNSNNNNANNPVNSSRAMTPSPSLDRMNDD